MKKGIILLTIVSLLLSILLFLPYSFRASHALPNAVDPIFYAWNLSHNLQSISHGTRDLLNTNIFYPEGNTLAFSDTLYAQTIMTAPVIYITNNPVLAENIYIFSTFTLSALSMFFLSYFITKHMWASAVSGIFFAFSYPRLAQIGHLPMISSQWIPLFILFLLQYIKDGSWKHLLLTFLLYVLNITSSIYFGVFLLPVIVIAFIVEPIKWKRVFKSFFVWVIPMAIILAVCLYPYIRLKAEYPTIKRSLEDTGRLSAQLSDYTTILPTSLIAHLGLYHLNTNEKPLYPTITVLLLALVGMIAGWKTYKKYILLFGITGLTAFLLSFGPTLGRITMPYYYLYKIIPVFQFIRVPARFSIILVVALAVLAAIGLTTLLTKKNMLLVMGIILALFLVEIWQIQTPSVDMPVGNSIPPVYQWLAGKPDSTIIVELPLRPEWRGIPMEEQLMRTYRETRDKDVYASETYRIYFSTIHHKRMINGYSGFFPQIYHDQAGILDNFPSAASIDLLTRQHIGYIIIHAWQYTDKNFSEIERQISQYPQLHLIQQFGDDYVYGL